MTLLFTLILMVGLAAIIAAYLTMVSVETRNIGFQLDDAKAFWAAEGGVQRGCRTVNNDRDTSAQTTDPTANGYCGTVFFDGYQAAGNGGANYLRACFYRRNPMTGGNSNYASRLNATAGAYVAVWDFQQRMNMIGTRIKSARIVMRARKTRNGGTSPIIQLQYTTSGGSSWINVGSTITLNSRTFSDFYRDAPTPANWSFIMDVNNFQLRAYRTNGGNRLAEVDWIGLELVLECDTLTEPWGSGSYISLPFSVGSATIESITVSDESSKVHLNYASQLLLQRLMEELFITNASDKATAIVNYRGSVGWFNIIEEVKQISNPIPLATGDFNTLKDYITVYSWGNNEVTRATGSRAPININTASEIVLRALFKTISLGGTRANDLASAIVADRAASPFTHMNSSKDYYDDNPQTFAYYMTTVSNFTASRENMVRENADASFYNRTETASWNNNNETGTEFCYYTNTFLITAMGEDGGLQRTVRSIYGETYNYAPTCYPNSTGTFALPIYIGETPKKYWRE
ncbi:MAG: hypothetical protein U9Q21_04595 [Candidatus Auribacterota bacterium]|nr:hypothetical protein [Candidatus Auribacterota bacterium]